jgi:hypothetical protein
MEGRGAFYDEFDFNASSIAPPFDKKDHVQHEYDDDV